MVSGKNHDGAGLRQSDEVKERLSPIVGDRDVLHMTVQIVAAYVSHNFVAASEVPNMVVAIFHAARTNLAANAAQRFQGSSLVPAVPIQKSINEDYIICLEDGGRFKTLVRHLRNSYEMSPSEYRTKWNLPHDYPMTAPGYSKKRSAIAREIEFARKNGPAVTKVGSDHPPHERP